MHHLTNKLPEANMAMGHLVERYAMIEDIRHALSTWTMADKLPHNYQLASLKKTEKSAKNHEYQDTAGSFELTIFVGDLSSAAKFRNFIPSVLNHLKRWHISEIRLKIQPLTSKNDKKEHNTIKKEPRALSPQTAKHLLSIAPLESELGQILKKMVDRAVIR